MNIIKARIMQAYMANLYPKIDHLKQTQWSKGRSGNPRGKKKGTKHISTWIQEMLNDKNFTVSIKDPNIEYAGAPVKAIVGVLILRALNGDIRAFESLAKYGYGNKLDLTSMDKPIVIPIMGGISKTSGD